IQDFIPIGSKEEEERFKRKGLRLEQDSAKKVKNSKEVSEEDLKDMMQLVPIEEVYVEALQIQDFIPIGSKEEEERFKRKGLRLEQDSAKKVKNSKEVSEEDLKDMMQLVSIEEVYVEALQEKVLSVELKRLYEPDVEDQLWTQTQALMHDPVEWRLYDNCGVHHILSRDQEIFMLVEREYPLRKGLTIAMIINKL
nr:hypothetical protein [Tanacetum cinerariifolium]